MAEFTIKCEPCAVVRFNPGRLSSPAEIRDWLAEGPDRRADLTLVAIPGSDAALAGEGRDPAEAGVLVRLDGEMDVSTAPGLTSEVERACTGAAHVVVDMNRVRFMDSTGLAALIDAQGRLLRQQGRLFLINPSTLVGNLLACTRMDLVFDVSRAVIFEPLQRVAAGSTIEDRPSAAQPG
jgi:anti-sigma B factor antagonist